MDKGVVVAEGRGGWVEVENGIEGINGDKNLN